MSDVVKKVTTATLAARKARNEKVVLATAYDYPTAVFADRAGVDALLVGDSAAMTVLGHGNTLAITMTEMLVFARAVARVEKIDPRCVTRLVGRSDPRDARRPRPAEPRSPRGLPVGSRRWDESCRLSPG